MQLKNKKRPTTILCLLALVVAAGAQSYRDTIYRIQRFKEIPVLTLSTSAYAVAIISIKGLEPRNPTDLDKLRHGSLMELDKWAIDNRSLFAEKTSDWLAVGSTILPLTLLADKKMRKDAFSLAVLAAETGLITQGLTNCTKRIVLRDRPYVFNPEVPASDRASAESMLSFFSGHTSTSASMSFFTAKVWSDYHPESRWKPLVWGTAAVLPAVTGYCRYKAGKHYFTDVVAGYIVGAATGYLVPHLHRIKKRHREK